MYHLALPRVLDFEWCDAKSENNQLLGLLAAHSLLPPSLENCLAWGQSKAGLAKGTINTKAIASVWGCSNEHPVRLSEASAVSSL